MVCLSLFHSITLLLCFSSHFLNLPSIHLLSPLCSYQSPSLSTILITYLLYIAISLFILSFCHLHHPFTLSTLTIWSFPLSLCHPHQLSTLLLLLSHPSPYLLPFQVRSIQHGHFTLRRVVFSLTTYPLIHFHFIHHSFISTFIVEMNTFTKTRKVFEAFRCPISIGLQARRLVEGIESIFFFTLRNIRNVNTYRECH